MSNSEIISGLILILFAIPILYRFKLDQVERYDKTDDRIMRLVPGDGHNLYELNMETLEMTDVSDEMQSDGENKILNIKDGCLYCTALNEKNAIKHFSRMVPGEFKKV